MGTKHTAELKPYICHVVSHTHWDRAWYLTFEQFRLRLIAMTDDLLDLMTSNSDFKWFVFDGQTVVLEDYLEVKPQMKSVISELVSSGRLHVGPQYVQPDEFLVTGESLVRNLLVGSRIARSFGRCMNVGYYPDCFGHINQMPQILNGFGIDSFMFMRGTGDEIDRLGMEFIWESPDNETSVLAVNLYNTYGNFRAVGVPYCDPWHFKPDYQEALKHADNEVASLSQRANTHLLLLNNGIDHHPAQHEIGDLIKYINKKRKNYRLVHSNFERYITALRPYRNKFKKFRGEFRQGFSNWLLSGVYSSRMYLKQENEKAQTILVHIIEPLSSYLWALGRKYLSDELLHLWKALFKNHPHDDICGCSIDAVHDDMLTRFNHIQQAAWYILWWYKTDLLNRIHLKPAAYGEPIVVFNTLPWERFNVFVEQEVFLPASYTKIDGLYLVDSAENQIPVEFSLLRAQPDEIKNEWRWGDTEMKKFRIRFYAPTVPAMGNETFYVRYDTHKKSIRPKASPLKSLNQGMENVFYKISINDDGTLNIFDKDTGLRMQRVHWFEDCADRGDEYDFSPVKNDKPVTTRNIKADSITLVESSPFRVVWNICRKWNLPVELSADRESRTKRTTTISIETEVILHAGLKRIDFHTKIINTVKDHRLRCGFLTPFATDSSFAETKFDVIERPHLTTAELERQKKKGYQQLSIPTAPQDRFTTLSDGTHGITFINRGLPEYEAGCKGSSSYYYLTLLRCVGWLSRPDLLTRRLGAGPTIAAPGGQCLGNYDMYYAITSHNGGWSDAAVNRLAAEHTVPAFVAVYENRFRDRAGNILAPERFSLVSIGADSPVIVSALKKAEERNSIIVRLFNPSDKTETVTLTVGKVFKKVFLCRLDEKRLNEIAARDKIHIPLCLKAHKIATMEIVF